MTAWTRRSRGGAPAATPFRCPARALEHRFTHAAGTAWNRDPALGRAVHALASRA